MSDPFKSVRDLAPDMYYTPLRQRPQSSVYRPDAIDIQVERILFAIEVHGPSVAYEEPTRTFIRSLYRTYPSAFWRIKMLVENAPHANDCTCWDCVERNCFELLRPWLMAAGQ